MAEREERVGNSHSYAIRVLWEWLNDLILIICSL